MHDTSEAGETQRDMMESAMLNNKGPWRVWVAAAVLSLVGVGCGSDGSDSADGDSSTGSFQSIRGALEAPSGVVDEETAPLIAEEFESASTASSAGGERFEDDLDYSAELCPAGGQATVSYDGVSSQASTAHFDYDNCCYQSSCCINGAGTFYTRSDTDTGIFSACASYDMTVDCSLYGSNATVSTSYYGCVSEDGWQFLVTVNNETFAVSGDYRNGSGTLDISGSNGSFTCTYSDGVGSCDGDATFTF